MTELIQNTPEWLAWRKNGIGASEANIIMGVSKFKTPLELWKEKVDPTPPKDESNFITDKGHALEDIARKNYEFETFLDWKPKLAEHSEEPRFRASLDGWNDTKNSTWECKYMGLDKYKNLRNRNLPIRERVPEEYWPQLMHQVMVTNAEQIRLTGIVDHKVKKELLKGETEQFTLGIKVTEEHHQYIKNELVPRLFEFLVCVDSKTRPVSNRDDVILSKDADLSKLLTKYKNIKTKVDKLAKEEKDLKKQIFAISLKIHNKVECKGHKISESISEDKTVPDYEKYLKEKDIDLIELGYTKITKGRKTQRITFKKEKE